VAVNKVITVTACNKKLRTSSIVWKMVRSWW
jgi:hypothetical protein